jgi:hypothetical protein
MVDRSAAQARHAGLVPPDLKPAIRQRRDQSAAAIVLAATHECGANMYARFAKSWSGSAAGPAKHPEIMLQNKCPGLGPCGDFRLITETTRRER